MGFFESIMQFLTYVGIIGVSLIAILIFGVFRHYKKKQRKEANRVLVNGMTKREFDAVINEAINKNRTIKKYGLSIKKTSVAEEVMRIHDNIVKIIRNLKMDPKDIKRSRKFLNYYLDTTLTILKRYTQIMALPNKTSEMEETLHNTEKMLKDITIGFDKQLQALQDNNVMDLSVEIELLKKTLKADGLVEKKIFDGDETLASDTKEGEKEQTPST